MVLRVLAVLLLVIPASARSYYLSPHGSDAASGLSAASAWASPNHGGLVCDVDTITAAPGVYDSANFASGRWGAVRCAAHGVVWLKCATFDACRISVSSGDGDDMDITASHWGVEGWEVTNTSGSKSNGNCFEVYPPGHANLTDIIVANSIANGCSGSGFASRNNGTAGVDYVAFVGDISYGAGSTNQYCTAAFSMAAPVAFDSQPGTHMYIGGDFGIATTNPHGCFDGEAFIFDTADGKDTMPRAYSQQMVIDHSLSIGNSGMGVVIEYNQHNAANPAGPYAPSYIRNVTSWNSATGSNLYGSKLGGEFVLYKTENSHIIDSVGFANAVGIGGARWNPSPAVMVSDASATSSVSGGIGFSPRGAHTSVIRSAGFHAMTNVVNADPGLPRASMPGAPHCQGFANVPACMAAVAANFIIAGPAGYKPPSLTPVEDPLFPQWLCGVRLPVGLVTMGCARAGVR